MQLLTAKVSVCFGELMSCSVYYNACTWSVNGRRISAEMIAILAWCLFRFRCNWNESGQFWLRDRSGSHWINAESEWTPWFELCLDCNELIADECCLDLLNGMDEYNEGFALWCKNAAHVRSEVTLQSLISLSHSHLPSLTLFFSFSPPCCPPLSFRIIWRQHRILSMQLLYYRRLWSDKFHRALCFEANFTIWK